jgi:uncharacterized protein YlzI (FlbEa/FlbD family)
MLNIETINKTISNDTHIDTIMASLLSDTPIKIISGGKKIILMDEELYNGLIETIRILQEDPSIVKSLEDREQGEFIDESDFYRYV